MNLNLKKISLKEIIYINKYKINFNMYNLILYEFIQILEKKKKKKTFRFQPLPCEWFKFQ